MSQEINEDMKSKGSSQMETIWPEGADMGKQEGRYTMKQAIKKWEDGREAGGEAERETLRMEVESKSRNEEFARVAVAVFISRLDPTLEEIDDVKTAVSEAVTNAVIHGYGGKEGIIYIQVTIEGRELSVEIEDRGVGIADVPKAMEPMFTTDLSGERSGMGFSFMEAFMDEIKVVSAPGQGTHVLMKKRIGR